MTKGSWSTVLVGAVLLVLVIGVLQLRRPAQTPTIFSDQQTLTAAIDSGRRTDRPVLAVVTADWCGPCQTLKRTTLSDAEVGAFLEENFELVYLEEGANRETVQSLPVTAFPTMLVLEDGEVVSGATGALGKGELFQWLRPIVSGG